MKMCLSRSWVILNILLVFVLVPFVNTWAMSPMEAIKDLDRQVEKYKVGKTLTPEEDAYNRKLKADIMKGTFDVKTLSEISLGRHWSTLSTSDQNNFVDLMTKLLQNKAIFAKEQSQTRNKSYRISYQKESYLDDQKQTASVVTSVTIPSENVTLSLSYKLKLHETTWKIFDVIVDQSSLIKNYAYQFNAIITKHGYPELVRRMQVKLDELKKKGGELNEPDAPVPTQAPAAPSVSASEVPVAVPTTKQEVPVAAPLQQASEKKGFFGCSLSGDF